MQRVELHLSSCEECAARLSTLQALFAEIESLPELELTRNISEAPLWGAAPFMGDRNLPAQLPRSLRLAVTLQAALALLAIFIAAPFVIEFVSPYSLTAIAFLHRCIYSNPITMDELAGYAFKFPIASRARNPCD